MTRFLVRSFRDFLHNRIEVHLFRDQWFVAFRKRQATAISERHMGDFTIINPPTDRFYADPFVVERNGKNYIFFEDYRFARQKAVISCVELDETGHVSKPEVVLERDYHLSYPCLFKWQGDIYMIPETHDRKAIEAYRASDFPRGWQLERVLMTGVSAVDSTIFEHKGKIWLFTAGLVDHSSLNDELFLFFSDSLFGPWKPHPKNPVVSDVRRARPAGQVFLDNGQLVRPGQDCSKGYGYAVSLNRVDVLSESDYREVQIEHIAPDWFPGNRGTHTLNQSDQIQVVDGRILVSRYESPWLQALSRSWHHESRPKPSLILDKSRT
jgi:hypothetical protein